MSYKEVKSTDCNGVAVKVYVLSEDAVAQRAVRVRPVMPRTAPTVGVVTAAARKATADAAAQAARAAFRPAAPATPAPVPQTAHAAPKPSPRPQVAPAATPAPFQGAKLTRAERKMLEAELCRRDIVAFANFRAGGPAPATTRPAPVALTAAQLADAAAWHVGRFMTGDRARTSA